MVRKIGEQKTESIFGACLLAYNLTVLSRRRECSAWVLWLSSLPRGPAVHREETVTIDGISDNNLLVISTPLSLSPRTQQVNGKQA